MDFNFVGLLRFWEGFVEIILYQNSSKVSWE
jgi:hypothetical protein